MATHLIFGEPGHPQVHGGDESNALAKGTDEPVSDRNPWQTLKKILVQSAEGPLRTVTTTFLIICYETISGCLSLIAVI